MTSSDFVDYLDKYIYRLVNHAKYEEAVEYIDSILPELVEINNRKKELDLLIKKGAILSMMGEYIDAQEVNKRASQLAMQLQCIKSEIKILNNSAIISGNFGDSNTAIFQYESALELAVKAELNKEVGEIKYNLGLVHYRIGNFKLASEYLYASERLALKMDDHEGVLLCKNVLGEIMRKGGEYKKALKIHRGLLKMAKEHALTKRIFDVKRNIFLDNFAIQKTERIVKSMENLLEEVEKIDARSLYTQITYDLAEMYFSLSRKDKSFYYLMFAEENVNLKIRTFLSSSIFSLIAHLSLISGKRYFKRAEKYCLYSLDWAEANSNFKEMVNVYILLGKLRHSMGKEDEAQKYFEIAKEKLILIDDEIIKKSVLKEYDNLINKGRGESFTDKEQIIKGKQRISA
ncbi:tetratricopeptide repeat protein [bacterium]|nr:tetratricopeptide repeat protein [bacterium]